MTKQKLISGLAVLIALPLATFGVHALSARTAAPAKSHAAAPVRLCLTVERQQMIPDAQGHLQAVWQPLPDHAPVQPGDLLRCTLRAENNGSRPTENLVLTQPIPSGATYVPSSLTVADADAQPSFLIEGETAYSAAPTVPGPPQADGTVVRVPAPASSYRALRCTFAQPLAPRQTALISFQEKVR